MKQEIGPSADGMRQIAGTKRVTSIAHRQIAGPVASSPLSSQGLTPEQGGLQVHTQLHSRPSSESLSAVSPTSPQHQQHQQQQYFSLPVYSEELGRLPLHGQIEFSPNAQQQQHHGVVQAQHQQHWVQGTHRGSSEAVGMQHGHPGYNVNVSVNVTASPSEPVSIQATGRQGHMQPGFEHRSPGGPSAPAAGMGESSSPGYGMAVVDTRAGSGIYGGAAYPSSRQVGPTHQQHQQQHRDAMYAEGSMQGHGHALALGHGHPYRQQQQQEMRGQIRYPGPSPGMGAAVVAPQHSHHQQLQGPGQSVQRHHQQQQNYVDSDTMAMWSNAPTGFE